MDDEVDALFSSSILDLCGQLEHHPSSVPSTVDFMFIAKYIERIGDHATNIAEWAIFVETGIHPNLNDAVAPPCRQGRKKSSTRVRTRIYNGDVPHRLNRKGGTPCR